jgi:broad specificity phosphatase PhoE
LFKIGMQLYFVRHGESEANTLRIISNRDLPYSLTETGRKQAAALAEKLYGRSFSCLYTSPILRAFETAEILSNKLQVSIECVDALREPDCGILEGRGDADAWRELDYWKKEWLRGCKLKLGPQGGETCSGVRQRITEFLEDLIMHYGDTDVELLLVTHGSLIQYGLPGVLEGLDQQVIRKNGLGYTVVIMAELLDGKLVYLPQGMG